MKRSRIGLAALLLAACTSSPPPSQSAGDPHVAVGSVEEELTRGNAPVHGAALGTRNWRADLLGTAEAPPVVGTDGTLYLASDQGFLTAVHPETGMVLWEVFLRGLVKGSPAVGPDGTLYVATDASSLHAVDPITHLEKWSLDLGNLTTSPVVGYDGTIYIGSQNSKFYAVTPTGGIKWTLPVGGPIDSTAAIGPDGTIYFGSNDNSVYAVMPGGTQKWKRPLTADVRSTPAVAGANVYVTSDASKLHAITAGTGAIAWEKAVTLTNVRSSPAVAPNGNVFVGASNNKVLGFTPTGTALSWTYTTGGPVNSSPIIDVEGRLYIGANDKKLHAVNSTTGQAIFTFTTGGAVFSPALDGDGRVVFGSADKFFYSVGKGRGFARGNDTTVSAGQPLAAFGRDLSLKVGKEGGVEKRTIVAFPKEQLVASVSKTQELVSAKLVLTKQPGSAASSTSLSAHLMNRAWNEEKATWSCANDKDASTTAANCDPADAWSMTVAGQLPYQATASATAALGSGTQVTFDVTADTRRALLGDGTGERDDVSWILRSAGADFVTFGSSESTLPPELILTFQPINKTAARDKKLQDFSNSFTDPVQKGKGAWLGWASVCELSRAMNGLSTNPITNTLVSDFTAEDRAGIQRTLADIQSIPSATAAGILGPFATMDPRGCTAAPRFDVLFETAQKLEVEERAKLRAPMCMEPNGDITVGVDEVLAPSGVDQLTLGRTAATARPVITGVDPTLYVDKDTTNANYEELGHPELVEDWRRNRGGSPTTTVPPATPNARYPGDGLSPFGVTTTISCNSTTFENDTCDHSAGLVCDTLPLFKRHPHSMMNKCLAFPVIGATERIRLRGYNFWDRSAPLVLQNVFNAADSPTLKQEGVHANNNSNPLLRCPTAADLENPSLESVQAGDQNTATYSINTGNGLYRLRMFNRNGSYKTQRDEMENRQQGRTIHVCRSKVETNPARYEQPYSQLPLNHGCTAPVESCVEDGLPCRATWTTPPRSLAECENDSNLHTPGSPVPDECNETPSYFGSDGPDVFIFVVPQRKSYTHRVWLDRVECTDETGCDNCGGSDEFEMNLFTLTSTALKGLPQDPKSFRDKTVRTYKNEFEHREIKHPEKLLQSVAGMRRSDEIFGWIQYLEADDESVFNIKLWGGIVTTIAAGVTAYVTESELATAAVVAAGSTACAAIMAAMEGRDMIGDRGWHGSYWELMKRVDYTHTPDFMITERNAPKALSVFPHDLNGRKTFESRLLHPIVGYGRDYNGIVAECSTASAGLPACGLNQTCYVNQCIGMSERDGKLTWPNTVSVPPPPPRPFQIPALDDPLYQAGYRARISFEGNDGKYKGDFEFALCEEGVDPKLLPLKCR